MSLKSNTCTKHFIPPTYFGKKQLEIVAAITSFLHDAWNIRVGILLAWFMIL